MTTETEDISPEEDVFRKKLVATHEAAGSPTVGMICRKAQEEYNYYDLDPKSVENWVKLLRIPLVRDTTPTAQPFGMFLKVLEVDDPDELEDWMNVARAALQAKKRREKDKRQKAAAQQQGNDEAPPPAPSEPTSPDDDAEHDSPEPSSPPSSADASEILTATDTTTSRPDDTSEAQPLLPPPAPITEHHDEDTLQPPQEETTEATSLDAPAPRADQPSQQRKRSILLISAAAAAVLITVIVFVVAPWNEDPRSSTGTPPGTSRESAAQSGGAQPGEITSFEAALDGSKTVGAPPAKTLGIWTKPSMNLDCGLSPCIPGTNQIAKVTLPETLTVLCVATGQTIRNGTPGDDGYYEDDRWVHIAPHPDIDGVGFLSNVWFARDKLPTNLAKCPI